MIFQNENFAVDELPNRCLLFVNSRKSLSDEEFEEILRLYRSLGDKLATYRCLAVTDGAGPTGAQRQLQQKQFGDAVKSITTAVVSDAITVRFIVSSAALFMKTIKAFDIRQFDAALAFVGLQGEDAARVRERLAEIPRGRFKTVDAILQR